MTQTPNEKGFFVQFPIYLISSCPDLTRDDKWVLLSLMQDHRTEGPFKLSFRSISTVSGVPLSLLSSYVDKKDVKHEGIMERIERVTGYIHCEMGKEIDPTTGKPKGNTQSYITINYTKIWQDNRLYSETKQNRPVSNTNTLFEPVLNTIKPVSNTNGSVPIQNRVVSNTNEPVSNSRSEVPPYITEDNKITLDTEEESDVTPTSSHPDTSSLTHSSSDLNVSQGGVPPSSDKGVSSDTLNLANAQSFPTSKPEKLETQSALDPPVEPSPSTTQHTLMQQSSQSVACLTDMKVEIKESHGNYKPTVWIYNKPHENASMNYTMFSLDQSLTLLQQLEQKRAEILQVVDQWTDKQEGPMETADLSLLPAPLQNQSVACTTNDAPPIAISSDTTRQKTQEVTAGTQGYTNGEKHVDIVTVDANQDGAIPSGTNSETPDNDAVLNKVDEMVTREMILKWILSRGALPGKQESQDEALTKLLPLITCEAHIGEIADIVKEQFRNKRFYVKNFAHDDILALWKALRPVENGLPETSEPYGMDATTCNGVIDDILARYPEWEQVIYLDERNAPVYFLGISLGNDEWVDVNRPSDWYSLDPDLLARVKAYVDWLVSQQLEKEDSIEVLEAIAV